MSVQSIQESVKRVIQVELSALEVSVGSISGCRGMLQMDDAVPAGSLRN